MLPPDRQPDRQRRGDGGGAVSRRQHRADFRADGPGRSPSPPTSCTPATSPASRASGSIGRGRDAPAPADGRAAECAALAGGPRRKRAARGGRVDSARALVSNGGRQGSSEAEQRTHKPSVAGSNPAPATNRRPTAAARRGPLRARVGSAVTHPAPRRGDPRRGAARPRPSRRRGVRRRRGCRARRRRRRRRWRGRARGRSRRARRRR